MTALAGGGNGNRLGRQIRGAQARDLKRLLSGTEAVMVARLEKVPTRNLNQLRQALASQEGSLHVVKNQLCRRVFQELGWVELEQWLGGTCGVANVRGDAASVAKLLAQFSKENEGFVLRGGILGGQLLQAREISALAALPSREVLLAQLVGGVRAPLSGLVGTLQGVTRGLVGVIHAVLKKQEGKG